MKTYKVPQDLNEEEKLIGGVASLRQTAYVVIGAVAGILLAIAIPISITGKVTVFSVFVVLGIGFGFTKVYDLNLDKLIFLYIRFASRKKVFCYERRKRIW